VRGKPTLSVIRLRRDLRMEKIEEASRTHHITDRVRGDKSDWSVRYKSSCCFPCCLWDVCENPLNEFILFIRWEVKVALGAGLERKAVTIRVIQEKKVHCVMYFAPVGPVSSQPLQAYCEVKLHIMSEDRYVVGHMVKPHLFHGITSVIFGGLAVNVLGQPDGARWKP
jgi:hypothetical protein